MSSPTNEIVHEPVRADASMCVVIPAHNESELIDACLQAVLRQAEPDSWSGSLTAIVVANACTDDTADRARSYQEAANANGIELHVVETAEGGKGNALNLGDAETAAEFLVYLDADVQIGDGMLEALAGALDHDDARYASGQIRPEAGMNWFVRLYAVVWNQLPFVSTDVSGCGLYSVNRAGRRRWHEFPQIHSDDKFVRLHFAPHERVNVGVPYLWPLPKNLWDLIKVRSRWCRGNTEFARNHPGLLANDQHQKPSVGWITRTALRAPVASIVFLGVYAAAAMRALVYRDSAIVRWERSR